MNMVEFFNRVAMMVATGILVEETTYLRAKAITKMIKVYEILIALIISEKVYKQLYLKFV